MYTYDATEQDENWGDEGGDEDSELTVSHASYCLDIGWMDGRIDIKIFRYTDTLYPLEEIELEH